MPQKVRISTYNLLLQQILHEKSPEVILPFSFMGLLWLTTNTDFFLGVIYKDLIHKSNLQYTFFHGTIQVISHKHISVEKICDNEATIGLFIYMGVFLIYKLSNLHFSFFVNMLLR